ncbi:Integrase [Clostridium perfringens]|nr:Integrase [Clostridium perfringens]
MKFTWLIKKLTMKLKLYNFNFIVSFFIQLRDIPEDRINFVKEILEHNYHEDRLFSIKGESINRYLNRIEDKLGIERHSNYDIRRLIAQEKFDSYRKSGLSIKDVANKTSAWLSHGDNRNEILEKSYIKLK